MMQLKHQGTLREKLNQTPRGVVYTLFIAFKRLWVAMSPPHSHFSCLSLLPLSLFLISFLGAGIYFSYGEGTMGFYAFSPVLATLPGVLLASVMAKSFYHDFLMPFLSGVFNKSVLLMCAIFLLAGMFSALAKSSGGVDATVSIGLSIIPSWFLLPGLFIITAFIATAMGTSVGTIAAVSPIAVGIAQSADVSMPLVAGVVLSGAMFGDNLSIISDTSIAATGTQNCKPKDKLKENIVIALPAALLVIVLYFMLSPTGNVSTPSEISPIFILPYVLIFFLAVLGVNVLLVLGCGLLSTAIIGMFLTPYYNLTHLGSDLLAGCLSMKDITLLTLVICGLSCVMEKAGGVNCIRHKLDVFFSRLIKSGSKKDVYLKGELAIASLVSLSNLATANNTIAILLSGRTAKVMSEDCGIEAKRAASLLDIFSCIVQGLIPWGAQLLLLGASFSLSPLILPLFCFYPVILGLVTCVLIIIKR